MGILLEKDPEMIHSILENGHDWAQDHIATSKESIVQVFDFLMNETKSGDMWKSVDLEDREDIMNQNKLENDEPVGSFDSDEDEEEDDITGELPEEEVKNFKDFK